MLSIRLTRTGTKKRPSFRIAVFDATRARDSRCLEVVGHYQPRSQPARVEVNRDRIAFWLKRGARPSDTVRTLLARHAASAPAPGGQAAGERGGSQ